MKKGYGEERLLRCIKSFGIHVYNDGTGSWRGSITFPTAFYVVFIEVKLVDDPLLPLHINKIFILLKLYRNLSIYTITI